MSKGGISITVSGGNLNLGNVSQGDRNTNHTASQDIATSDARAFSDFFRALDEANSTRLELGVQLESLRSEVAVLKSMADRGTLDKKASLIDTAKTLIEKYGWAAELLRKLFFALLPGVVL